MLSLSVRTRIGLYVLVELAREPGEQRSVEFLANYLEVSANHLAKVMQTLARTSWVMGTRGPSGGYKMVANAREISMADVVELFEGSPELDTCGLSDGRPCGRHARCEIKTIFREIEEQAYFTMKSVTLDMLAFPANERPPLGGESLPIL